MEIFSKFKQNAKNYPKSVCIRTNDQEISYGEFLDEIYKLADLLAAQGVEPGDVAAIYSDNNASFLTFFLASSLLKLVVVPLDIRMREEETLQYFLDAKPRIAVFDKPRPFTKLLDPSWKEKSFSIRLSYTSLEVFISRDVARHPNLRSSDFVVQYSSGSTGKPKGILLSQQNLVNKVENWIKTLGLSNEDVFLNTLTLSHCYGLYVHSLTSLIVGGLLVLPDLNTITPRRICEMLQSNRATFFGSLPFMYSLMAKLPISFQPDFSKVRYFVTGSAPLGEEISKAFFERFGRNLNQVFGLTEIGLITFNRIPNNPLSIGTLTHNMEAMVFDENGKECPVGKTGELIVRANSISRGYLSNENAQKTMFKNGWLFTKDLVYRDHAGYFFVVGRNSRIINVNGNKVSPLEIESALLKHPNIVDATVASLRDNKSKEQIIAFVVASTKITTKDLITFCNVHLDPTKIPKKIVFVQDIPKTPLGKTLPNLLIDTYLNGVFEKNVSTK